MNFAKTLMRNFLLALTILSLFSCAPPKNSQSGQKPNIVVILADDMTFDDLNYMPKTAELIGNNGATFDQAIVTMSLCCPSRVSILRGQYPHNSQITGNNAPAGGFEKAYGLGLEDSTVAVWLKDAGYMTAMIGKYLNGYPAELPPTYIPPGWSEWYVPAGDMNYSDSAYTGFNYVLNENGQLTKYGNQPEDYTTDVFTAKAVEFIERNSKTDTPFFLYVSTYTPHKPSTPAPRHKDLFPEIDLPDKPSINELDIEDKSRFFDIPSLSQPELDELRDKYRLRIQSLQSIDDMVEQIYNTLMDTGLLDETYIIFTSDNGYHMGEHRLLAGKNTPFEEDIRVPLLVSGPRVKPGLNVNKLVSNIDFAPTFAELAGIQSPDFVDGRSLVPLLENRWFVSWRNAITGARGLSSYNSLASLNGIPSYRSEQEPLDSPFDLKAGGQFVFIRTEEYTYVEFLNGDIELYDLKKDPFQLNNIASTADPKLLSRLSHWLVQLSTCKEDICRKADIKP